VPPQAASSPPAAAPPAAPGYFNRPRLLSDVLDDGVDFGSHRKQPLFASEETAGRR